MPTPAPPPHLPLLSEVELIKQLWPVSVRDNAAQCHVWTLMIVPRDSLRSIYTSIVLRTPELR